MKIRLSTDQRVLFVGTTGSGKSELAKHFLRKLNRVIVIDPKFTFQLEGYKRQKHLPYNMALGFRNMDFHIIYRPRRDDTIDLAQLFYRIGKMREITIYIDELSTLSEQFIEATQVLADVVRTGRERHISVWSAIQRPRWVPRIFLTEAENIFQFQLRSEDDRRYMAGFIGQQVMSPLTEHNFWYSGTNMQAPALLRLDLQKDGIIQVQ